MLRKTSQRKAIRQAFERAGRPLSPRELLDEARGDVPGLGIATVYRAIKGLLTEGELEAVDIPGQAPRYELAGKPPHHHFVCERSGKVFDVPASPNDVAVRPPAAFRVDRYSLVLFGTCADE